MASRCVSTSPFDNQRIQWTHVEGFTVIELLIATLVVLTIMAVALPQISRNLDAYWLLSASHDVGVQIQNARYRALKTNATVSFLASGGHFGTDSNADGNLTSSQDVNHNLPNGIAFVALTSPPVSGATNLDPTGTNTVGVAFTPQGTSASVTSSGTPDYSTAFSANGVALYLRNRHGTYAAVTIGPTGRVRTWRSNNGSTWAY